jgi:hypothetical protein
VRVVGALAAVTSATAGLGVIAGIASAVAMEIPNILQFIRDVVKETTEQEVGEILTRIMHCGFCVLERKGKLFSSSSTVKFRGDLLPDAIRKGTILREFDDKDSAKVLKALRAKDFGLDVYKGQGSGKDLNATLYVAQLDPNGSWPDFNGAEATLSDDGRWQFDAGKRYIELSNAELCTLLRAQASAASSKLYVLGNKEDAKFTVRDGKTFLYCSAETLKEFRKQSAA